MEKIAYPWIVTITVNNFIFKFKMDFKKWGTQAINGKVFRIFFHYPGFFKIFDF